MFKLHFDHEILYFHDFISLIKLLKYTQAQPTRNNVIFGRRSYAFNCPL